LRSFVACSLINGILILISLHVQTILKAPQDDKGEEALPLVILSEAKDLRLAVGRDSSAKTASE
jgi:hypothetical protein